MVFNYKETEQIKSGTVDIKLFRKMLDGYSFEAISTYCYRYLTIQTDGDCKNLYWRTTIFSLGNDKIQVSSYLGNCETIKIL